MTGIPTDNVAPAGALTRPTTADDAIRHRSGESPVGVSVVVPVFNEVDSVSELVDRLMVAEPGQVAEAAIVAKHVSQTPHAHRVEEEAPQEMQPSRVAVEFDPAEARLHVPRGQDAISLRALAEGSDHGLALQRGPRPGCGKHRADRCKDSGRISQLAPPVKGSDG